MTSDPNTNPQKTAQKKRKRFIDPDELKLSNSKISMLKQCELRFFFSYVIGLPQEDKDHFLLGSFVHLVLELFYLRIQEDRSQKIAALMGRCFADAKKEYPDILLPEKDELLKTAKTMLAEYMKKAIAKQPLADKMLVEEGFEITVDGVKVIGFIDRIDFHKDGSVKVLDYKSGKRAKDPKEFREDLQLPIYALAIQDKYGTDLDDMECKLLHVRIGKEQALSPSQETIERTKEEIRKANQIIQDNYKKMRAENWDKVAPKHLARINQYKRWSPQLENDHIMFINKYRKHWKKNENKFCAWCDFYRQCNNAIW